MGGGRLIRLMIAVLVVVLIWKVWDYSELPVGESVPEEEEAPAALLHLSPSPTPTQQQQQLEVAVYPPLRVEVYYEALCPDSRYFIMKQLTPAYEKLNQILDVAFIPYGKATTHEKDGKFTFECQHGQLECKANLVHACVTNVVKNEEKQLSIISCMIDKNSQPMKAGQKCVDKYDESWENIESCVLSEKGTSIMKHMGDMTNSLKPPVFFIPTITIDGSQDDQKHILQDLHKVLCKRYKGLKQSSC